MFIQKNEFNVVYYITFSNFNINIIKMINHKNITKFEYELNKRVSYFVDQATNKYFWKRAEELIDMTIFYIPKIISETNTKNIICFQRNILQIIDNVDNGIKLIFNDLILNTEYINQQYDLFHEKLKQENKTRINFCFKSLKNDAYSLMQYMVNRHGVLKLKVS